MKSNCFYKLLQNKLPYTYIEMLAIFIIRSEFVNGEKNEYSCQKTSKNEKVISDMFFHKWINITLSNLIKSLQYEKLVVF